MAASSASDLESADYEALPSLDSVSRPKLLIFACILVACTITVVGYGLLFSPQLLSARSFFYSPQDESNSIIFEHTAFHFQPDKNWMNDPNGPLYYNGYYHLFYQYNPYSAVWGNITWGHAVSKDLLHWEQLELAMVPDQWYDADGVWSGSATVLPDGKIIMLYTGSTNESVQVQNMAVPKDYSDPLLREWIKAPFNPILEPPPGIGTKDFRDPTTAWLQEDGLWRIAIGAKKNTTGVGLIYQTSDFIKWKLQEHFLREVPLTGMWECIDFYPIALSGSNGLDTSRVQVNSLVKYVIKVSLDDTRHDHYAIGTYDTDAGTWTPDDPVNDVGTGLRYDYGKYYASKTFFDPVKQRRILWGWANESDSEIDDLNKGWASVQTMPREVYLDTTTGSHLIQWPIEEVNSLRDKKIQARNDLLLEAGSVVEVKGAEGGQLDINVEFEYPDVSNVDVLPEETYECSQGGSAHRGVLGPFGLLVLAGKDLQEQTAVYFYLTLSSGGQWKTRVCSDQSRSSLESGIDKTVYGTVLPKLSGDNALSLRVIVDHSVVESYVQGGRTCITSRVYPTIAVGKEAHLFLFNNGTKAISLRSFEAWHMKSTKDMASITSLAVEPKGQIE